MFSRLKIRLALLCFALLAQSVDASEAEELGALEYLPAILANVERRPPPPARWQVTSEVACPSFNADWTVNDGENTRSSELVSQFASPKTSSFAVVEPGPRSFSWRLDTRGVIATCGVFNGGFSRNLKSGFDYEFVLKVTDSGGLTVQTKESVR